MPRISTVLTASALALTMAGAAMAQNAPVAQPCADPAAQRDDKGNCVTIVVQNGSNVPVGGLAVGLVLAVGVLGAGLATTSLGGSGSH